jgi:hypothetical protein
MRFFIASTTAILLTAGCGQSDTNFVEQRRYAPAPDETKDGTSADATGAEGTNPNAAAAGAGSEAFGDENSNNGAGIDGAPGSEGGAGDGTGAGGDGTADQNGTGSGEGSGNGSGNGEEGSGSNTGSGGSNGSGGNMPPPSVEEVLATCANSPRIQMVTEVSFPSRRDCSWGTTSGGAVQLSANGNLPIKNGWIRAREEQTVSINVPQGAILCSLELSSKTNQIHFDDFFSMRVDQYVVAASKVLANALIKDAGGHYTWDWPRIRGDGSTGAGTQMQDIGKYCGAGDCLLPEHDTPGAFALNFSLEDNASQQNTMNAALFAKLANKTKIDITATATGDNDDDDCFHSGGEFTAKIYYVQK